MGFGAQVHLVGEDEAWCAGAPCAGLRLSELMLLLQGWGVHLLWRVELFEQVHFVRG